MPLIPTARKKTKPPKTTLRRLGMRLVLPTISICHRALARNYAFSNVVRCGCAGGVGGLLAYRAGFLSRKIALAFAPAAALVGAATRAGVTRQADEEFVDGVAKKSVSGEFDQSKHVNLQTQD